MNISQYIETENIILDLKSKSKKNLLEFIAMKMSQGHKVEKDIIFETIGNNEFLKKGNTINKIDILFNKIEKGKDND